MGRKSGNVSRFLLLPIRCLIFAFVTLRPICLRNSCLPRFATPFDLACALLVECFDEFRQSHHGARQKDPQCTQTLGSASKEQAGEGTSKAQAPSGCEWLSIARDARDTH